MDYPGIKGVDIPYMLMIQTYNSNVLINNSLQFNPDLQGNAPPAREIFSIEINWGTGNYKKL